MPLIRAIAILLLLPVQAAAQRISYDVIGYGSRHVVVVLSGTVPVGVTTSMSADGKSARVSAAGVEFVPANSGRAMPALVSSAQQVKRGSAVDLVINLNQPAELDVTAGGTGLKLLLKVKNSGDDSTSNRSSANQQGARPQKTLPIRFTLHADPEAKNAFTGLTVVLPKLDSLGPGTIFARELRRTAYALDLVWAALNGVKNIATPISGQKGEAESAVQVAELEKLVQDLTRELVELRKKSNIDNGRIDSADGNVNP